MSSNSISSKNVISPKQHSCCLLCGCNSLKDILHITHAPINIQRLLKKEELVKDHKIDLYLVQCTACHLYQLGDLTVVPTDYYDDYIMTTSFSKQISVYINELAKMLIEKYNLYGKLIYEIGCGDGIFCEHLNANGAKTIGVEPSKRFGKLAENKGISVIYDYFTVDLAVKEASVDAIVSRAVFEHLKDPTAVLAAMYKFLKEDGIGLIEVPSFEKAIAYDRYYDVFSDHVAYYTKESLVHLVTRNNFEVLEIFDSYNDEFLVVIFRKKKKLAEQKFISNFEQYKSDFKKNIDLFISKGKSIAMWGAGGKGLALLSMCDCTPNQITYILDSDPNKIGRFTPGSHIEIYSPNHILTQPTDILIISAMAYEKEILEYLSSIKFKGEIYVISPILKKIDMSKIHPIHK